MFKKITIIALLIGSINLSAHEGSDHAQGTLKANHGGIVKAGKDINLEYVVSSDDVILFIVGQDGIDLKAKDLKLITTVKLPKEKAKLINLEMVDGANVAKSVFNGAARAEFIVKVSTKGKQSTFKFQAEK